MTSSVLYVHLTRPNISVFNSGMDAPTGVPHTDRKSLPRCCVSTPRGFNSSPLPFFFFPLCKKKRAALLLLLRIIALKSHWQISYYKERSDDPPVRCQLDEVGWVVAVLPLVFCLPYSPFYRVWLALCVPCPLERRGRPRNKGCWLCSASIHGLWQWAKNGRPVEHPETITTNRWRPMDRHIWLMA